MTLNRKTSLILILLSVPLLSGCTWPFAKKSGLSVNSQPQSEVIINGQVVGKTPLTLESLTPGASTIRLVPPDATLEAYETKINLVSGTKTIVTWDFGLSKSQSGGYSLSFEKHTSKSTGQLSIISLPNTSSVTIDGKPEGFTPLQTESLTPGSHTITVTSAGYQDRTIKVNIANGYKTVLNVTLAMQQAVLDISPTPEATPTATLSVTPSVSPVASITPTPSRQASVSAMAKPYVEILNTPTGFLRVRETPSGTEVAQVKPGEVFAYLESTVSGWFKIVYAPKKEGFVSSQYAKLVR